MGAFETSVDMMLTVEIVVDIKAIGALIPEVVLLVVLVFTVRADLLVVDVDIPVRPLTVLPVVKDV